MLLVLAASSTHAAPSDGRRRVALVTFDPAGHDTVALRTRLGGALARRKNVDLLSSEDVAAGAFDVKALQCGVDAASGEKLLAQAEKLSNDGKAKEALAVLDKLVETLETAQEPSDGQLDLLRRARIRAAGILVAASKGTDQMSRANSEEGLRARSYLKAIVRTFPMFALAAAQYTPSVRLVLDYARLDVEKEPKAALSVTSDIPGAEVMLEGRSLGVTPLQTAAVLPEGRYRVWTRLGARRSRTRFINVPADSRVTLDLATEPALVLCNTQLLGFKPELSDTLIERIADGNGADVMVVRAGHQPFLAGSDGTDFQLNPAAPPAVSTAANVRVDFFDRAKGHYVRRGTMVESTAVDVAEELTAFALGERPAARVFRPRETPSVLVPGAEGSGVELVPSDVAPPQRRAVLGGLASALAGAGLGVTLPFERGASARALWWDEKCGQHPAGWKDTFPLSLNKWESYALLQDCTDVNALRAARAEDAHLRPSTWLAQVYVRGKDALVVFTPRSLPQDPQATPMFLRLPVNALEDADQLNRRSSVLSRIHTEGQLQLVSAVEGVELKLDGVPLMRGMGLQDWAQPLASVATGKHVLEARFPGFNWATVVVTVKAGRRTVVTLRSKDGQLLSDQTDKDSASP